MDDNKYKHMGSTKLSQGGTTTIPSKLRAKAYWLPEDVISFYYNNENGIVKAKNETISELVTAGNEFLAKSILDTFKENTPVIVYQGDKGSYYPSEILAALLQCIKGKISCDGEDQFFEFMEDKLNLEDGIKGDDDLLPQDKLLYREVRRYYSERNSVGMYLANYHEAGHIPIKDKIEKIMRIGETQILIFGTNNSWEKALQLVNNLEEYIFIKYTSDTAFTVEKRNAKKGTIETIS